MDSDQKSPPGLLYRYHGSMKVGDVHRFIITYTPENVNETSESIFARVKNTETVLLRPNVLTGPYMLYCDIEPSDFDHMKHCFITADQPHYNPSVMPGQSIKAELSMHTLKPKYCWTINVSSQIVFNRSSEVNFEVIICNKVQQLHKNYYKNFDGVFDKSLDVQHLSTIDLWNKPPPLLPSSKDTVHLVILTHGLYSNSTADLLYLKENIEQACAKTGENVVVRGYTGNVCRTERGVKYLGRRLAEWIVRSVVPDIGADSVQKISFIAHSLGGLVQTFAIAYIQHNGPEFFDKIHPENFITLASPLLGISNENPAYVNIFLSVGIVGKTGRDLGLKGNKPLLLLLPSKSTRKILAKFKRRTVYANVVHDGIVPLRTAALMFLDWKGLTKVYNALKDGGETDPNNIQDPADSANDDKVGKIPDSMEEQCDAEEDQTTAKPPDSGIEVPTEENSESNEGFGWNKLFSWFSDMSTPSSFRKERKVKKYQKFQTSEALDRSIDTVEGGNTENISKKFSFIPKTNVLSGISRVLLPPAPTAKFLLDPSFRKNIILHDKIYKPRMIPKREVRKKSIVKNTLNIKEQSLEETIARKWHRGLSWRKVLVYLPPDAHNNMIVRRTFANAYGWPVIDHLIQNHFSERCFKGEDLKEYQLTEEDEQADMQQEEEDADKNEGRELDDRMSTVLDKEHNKALKEGIISAGVDIRNSTANQGLDVSHEGQGQGEECTDNNDRNNNGNDDDNNTDDVDDDDGDNDEWISENDSICYDGPTGMLNTIPEGVSGQVKVLKNTLFSAAEEKGKGKVTGNNGYMGTDDHGEIVRDAFVEDPSQVMNTYI